MTTIATLTLNPAIDIAATAPEVVPTIKIRCGDATVQAGGGGINVARVATRFGRSAVPIVIAGGATGERLLALLAEEGLSPSVVRTAHETRESFTVTDARSHEQFRFVLPGPTLAGGETDAVLEALAGLRAFPSLVVLSGSHPAGVPETFIADLSALVRKHGAQLIVDGPGEVLCAARDATLIKPNERELAALSGRPLPTRSAIIAAARQAIRDGLSRNVLVSMGGDGALLVTAERVWRYAVPPVNLVSAVGAGDSMVGSIAVALAAGEPLEAAVARGAAAGSAALLTRGTDLCRPEDVERLLPDISQTIVEGDDECAS